MFEQIDSMYGKLDSQKKREKKGKYLVTRRIGRQEIPQENLEKEPDRRQSDERRIPGRKYLKKNLEKEPHRRKSDERRIQPRGETLRKSREGTSPKKIR
jgi:hypothetical protein